MVYFGGTTANDLVYTSVKMSAQLRGRTNRLDAHIVRKM